MRKPIFDQSLDNKKRLDKLEKVCLQLIRKSKKTVTVLMPPVPISSYVVGEDVYGSVLKHILFKGKLTKAVFILPSKPKSNVMFDISVLNGDIKFAKGFYVSSKYSIQDIDINTEDGSVVDVSVGMSDSEEKLTSVAVALLWIPDRNFSDVEKLAIDELEKLIDDMPEV